MSEVDDKNKQLIEQYKSVWFKGIQDALVQEPDENKYWDDDLYFSGYQRGTEIFRSLMKESNLLFPQKLPKIKKDEL